MKEYPIILESVTALNESVSILSFYCSEIAKSAIPGQFINISCKSFLKRPFGIMDADASTGLVKIGIRNVGKGSRELTHAKPGDAYSIIGPLGHGLDIDSMVKTKKLLLIGGGTGIFPIHFTCHYAKERGYNVTCVNGYRSKSESLLLSEFEALTDQFIVATDSGDYGMKGTALDAVISLPSEALNDTTLFVVGPEIMMKKISEWAATQALPCYVSMEKRMACGIGACLVCVCKIKAEEQGVPFKHARCCKDGPVFSSEEVIF